MIVIQHHGGHSLKRQGMVFFARHLTAEHSVPMAKFSYDHGEIKKLELKVKRKLQVLRMFSELKDFDYEPPTMSYDKKTGEIIIEENKGKASAAAQEDKKGGKKTGGGKKVISSMDDLEKERKALFAEMGLNNEGKPKNDKEPEDKVAEKIKAV